MSHDHAIVPMYKLHAEGAQALAKSHSQPRRRMLVVDDDTHIRQICSAVLIRAGYQVDTAADGEAGWKALHAVRHDPDSYDLLITDNHMPKLSGVDLIKKLRSARILLPIILASGSAPTNTEWLHLAESLQLAAILPKPFSPDWLRQTMNGVLHTANRDY